MRRDSRVRFWEGGGVPGPPPLLDQLIMLNTLVVARGFIDRVEHFSPYGTNGDIKTAVRGSLRVAVP